MPTETSPRQTAERGHVTRAIEVVLDPSASQERWLRSYAGSMRAAYNWVLAEVTANLATRAAEREAGVPDDELTPALSWSRNSLIAHWRANRDEVHPWHHDISIHCFRTGVENASLALKNFSESKGGSRRGRRIGFPRFKNRHSRQAIRFVEMAEGVDHRHWINADTRRHVRLMLPQRATEGTWERRHTRPRSQQAPGRARRDELAWIRAHDGAAAAEVWRLCEAGQARVQALTLKLEGGRWRAVFQLRVFTDTRPDGRLRNPGEPVAWHGGAISVDLGVTHLATLDRPVPDITDSRGHVANPRVLDEQLRKLRQLDRATARCRKGSRNRAKLLARRARLHGRITDTRKLHIHDLTNRLAGGFDVVVVEDLNIAGMGSRGGRLGRQVRDAALGEVRRQLDYKARRSGMRLVAVDRFYPSSQTCSACGARTKLPRHATTFDCVTCGTSLDRDVNAARNIKREGLRLLREQLPPGEALTGDRAVAPIRGETRNGDPRGRETDGVPVTSGLPPSEDATVPATPGRHVREGNHDLRVAVA